MAESSQEMIGRLMQGSYQESERDRLNKIRAMKDYERWAEKQGTEKAKDEYSMEQEYLRFLQQQQQQQQMEGDLDKDVRDWRTRPLSGRSPQEFVEPPRGGPSSYMRSVGRFSEMLNEMLDIAGPGKFMKALKGAFASRKVPKLKGRTTQETIDQAKEWTNWFNKGRK